MKRVCKACNNEYELHTFNRDVEQWVVDVCSLPCFLKWFKCLGKVDKIVENKLQNFFLRPFRSALEEKFFFSVKPHTEVLYEPYILKINNTIYIPDFYLPEKNIFIEIKGSRQKITKFKKFARHYPLYILFPEVLK